MPRSWHDRHTVNKIEDDDTKMLYRELVADKKPYFMRYIYPALMKQYNTYIKNTNCNALREFRMTVDEMKSMPYKDLTDRQKEFLKYYDYKMPVGVGDCVMNKICRRFEEEFDGYVKKRNSSTSFDYSIMKRGCEYTQTRLYSIKKLYDEYNRCLKNYKIFTRYERVNEYKMMEELAMMDAEFLRECEVLCQNKYTLCDITLDLCYKHTATKKFAWGMCKHEIIDNLLEANDCIISFPVADENGEIEYGGRRYTIQSKKIEVVE